MGPTGRFDGSFAEIPGDFRIRLSSIEATEITRELLDVMAEHADRVCPHFHVCLQSGSEKVLRRMRRRWGAKRFVDRCQLIRERLPDAALTTDVIIGFPGETDEDFADTCRVCEASQFSKIHMFPFSARKGTPAANMDEQISKPVKVERGKQLADLEARLRSKYVASLQGKTLQVLIEGQPDDPDIAAVGTACRYLPVYFPASIDPQRARCTLGDLTRVTAGAAYSDGLLAGPTGI